MNANDLADRLEEFYTGTHITKAAEVLRQQQAEIESMKNPIMQAISQAFEPAKTLTDEEIEEVYRTVEQDFALTESKKPDGGWRNFPVELARAILRKAQEK